MQLDVVGERERRRRRGRSMTSAMPCLEAGAVDDEQVGVGHRLGLARRRRELVGIGADRHDHLDVGLVADDLAHDVAEDARGDDDVRPLVAGVRPRPPHDASTTQSETENRSHFG